jgi:hypothetical protein
MNESYPIDRERVECKLIYNRMLLREWDKMPDSLTKYNVRKGLKNEILALTKIINKLNKNKSDGN